ncbi:MAG TPA: hypothetical protein VNV60_03120, partial [Holophagaceae bacterium]|nr:hypothetical protein [Holophagaceae bacterium]
GYNTDVRHGNRVYHVQTEDKGLTNPKVETLIYVGGEILDSYRSAYEDLLVKGALEEGTLQARMDEQHKSIIRDIKAGKYDATPPDDLEKEAFNDRPLDQAILEFLQREGDVDTLEVVLDQPLKPIFGEAFPLNFKVRLSRSQAPVAAAEVTVKLVSSLKKAVVLEAGKTDGQGVYAVEVKIPPSQPGQCALLVTCASEQGMDEVKALIRG